MLFLGPAFATVFALFGGHQQSAETPVVFSNSPRLERLIRGGNLYLSLRDAIALALENNLDIDSERYVMRLAGADLERASGGGPLRGLGFINSPQPGGAVEYLPSSTLDPVLSAGMSWNRSSLPASPFLGGFIPSSSSTLGSISISQRFLSGTQVTTSLISQSSLLSGTAAKWKPAAVQVFVSQPLLRGFGTATNGRAIQIARNQSIQSDLEFTQRVVATVESVIGAYWNLVSLTESVEVARRGLRSAEQLYDDNKIQLSSGVIAPIELVRAEAEIAARRQDLTTSDAKVRQLEIVLKDMLTRSVNPAIAAARIITTDRISVPDIPAVQPLQDLIQKANESRPEIGSLRTNLQNDKLRVAGSRNALLPSLNLFAGYTSNAQTSVASALSGPALTASGMAVPLMQIFAGSVPDYQVGFQLTIPLRNRSADADYATSLVGLRRSEIDLQRAKKQIAFDVQNALVGLEEAKARYNAALKQRVLEQQTLDADRQRRAAGMATVYQVIQTERDFVSAEANEVSALCQYAQAQLDLDRATGQILSKYHVSMEEARSGRVAASPASLLDEASFFLPIVSPAFQLQRLRLLPAVSVTPAISQAVADVTAPEVKIARMVLPPPAASAVDPSPRTLDAHRQCKACALEADGRRLTAEGRWDEALNTLNRSIAADPARPSAYNARGYLQIRRREYRAGIKDFTAALDRNPKYLNAYQNRAIAERFLGDKVAASLDAQRANELAK